MALTILNVEDVSENRALVRRILEARGYRVIEAEDARQGIAKAVEERPALILMDINLPDIDGFSAVTKIRSYPDLVDTPIVALTARDVANDQERALAIGCDGYLNKPISVTKLLAAVSEYLSQPRQVETPTPREFYLREQSLGLVEKLERRLDELEAIHQRLQRLDEAKTDFIFLASHELRTPLTMVQGYADMLNAHPSVNSDAMLREMVDGLKKGTDRLHAIVDDMLSLVRVQQTPEDLDYSVLALGPIINQAVTGLKDQSSGRDLEIQINVPLNLPAVNGDEAQLRQVFERLVSNAIKYTPDGGRITIEARPHLNGARENGARRFIEVIVRDTGIGIDKADQRLIFEKFYTAEDTRLHSSSKTQFMGGGPGLGLTIARGYIEAHGGRIWVESNGHDPERLPGSTFFVLLPAVRS
ncbi:MAG: ATP-binding protein [Anaerolineae bacterium]